MIFDFSTQCPKTNDVCRKTNPFACLCLHLKSCPIRRNISVKTTDFGQGKFDGFAKWYPVDIIICHDNFLLCASRISDGQQE